MPNIKWRAFTSTKGLNRWGTLNSSVHQPDPVIFYVIGRFLLFHSLSHVMGLFVVIYFI